MADFAHVDKAPQTRHADINKPECETLEYRVVRTGMEHPSSITWYIECPFCFAEVKAYLWSLCGGGKNCGCGALFGSHGNAYKMGSRSNNNSAPEAAE